MRTPTERSVVPLGTTTTGALAGSAIIVTGACGTIGRVISEALVRSGARVALLDSDAGGLCALAAGLGPAAVPIPGDHTDAGTLTASLDRAFVALGTVDGAVCSAGYQAPDPTQWSGSRDWIRQIDAHATGIVRAARMIGERLAATGRRGSIVMTAHTAARVIVHPRAGRPAARSNLTTVTRSLAKDWQPAGIRVNAVTPDYPRTELLPAIGGPTIADRWAECVAGRPSSLVEDVGDTYVYLLCERSGTVTGQDVSVSEVTANPNASTG